jgi:stage III sporulation protein AG
MMSFFEAMVASSRKIWPLRLFREGVLSPRLVLLGLVGLFLLTAGSLFDSLPERKAAPAPQEAARSPAAVARSYEEALEGKLANLLSQVKGAGAVAVSITLDSGSSQEFAKNLTKENRVIQERDNGGGLRTTTETKENEQVLLSRENGVDRPVMVREIKPAVKGVLVIAEGAGDSAVKANLTRAVEAGLGVPAYRITVLPQRK